MRLTLWIGGAVGILLVTMVIVGTIVGPPAEEKASVKAAPSASTPSPAPAKTTASASPRPAASSAASSAKPSPKPVAKVYPTATQVVDRLSHLYPLPNPTDNTGGCSAPGRTDGCVQLITTDSVSVYQFGSPAVARKWVKTMRANGDWRQVDRYALAWTARDQKLTSQEARADMVAELKRML